MTNIEAMKLALDALEPIAVYKAHNGDDWPARQIAPAIAALRQAISEAELIKQNISDHKSEQAEQKPVAWMNTINGFICKEKTRGYHVPLYTAPPQRQWVDPSNEQLEYLVSKYDGWNLVILVLKAAKERNNG